MSLVVVSIDIDAPPQAVWDAAMDPHRTTEWVTIARGVRNVGSGPLAAGFRMEQRLCLRGVPFWVQWELAEADEPRFARWEGKGPAGSKALIEDVFEERRTGTRFEYRNEFRTPFGPLGSVASRVLVGGIPEREASASLRRLKALLESQPARSAL